MSDHARLFADAGHTVSVVCLRGASDDARIRLELLDREGGDALETQLHNVLRAADLVFVHNVCTMPFDLRLTDAVSSVAARLPLVRFICWVHDLAAQSSDDFASRRFEYVAVSEYRRHQFQQRIGEDCRVIPNGVDPVRSLDLTKPVTRLLRERQLFAKEAVLLHPTRVLPRKNIELSLAVTAALRDSGADVCTLITAAPDRYNRGAAEYACTLRRLRKELKIENEVVFLHDHFEVTDADLASLFRVADALLFPSREEGFGLPVLEGAIHRLPVFCADQPPLNSCSAQSARFFAPQSAPTVIAAQIMGELRASRDIQARKLVARDYGWDAIYQKFLAPLLAETPSLKRP